MSAPQRVPIANVSWAAPIEQVLIALEVWPKLTSKQRRLVSGQRDEIKRDASYPDRYKVRLDGIQAAPRTMQSLQAKGVVDDRGQLTEVGVYAALWGDR